jgi:hypothetical protein
LIDLSRCEKNLKEMSLLNDQFTNIG